MRTIVDDDIETSGQSHDELLTRPIRVATSDRATWHVVNPKGPFNLERQMLA
jgi:hypothetical protein